MAARVRAARRAGASDGGERASGSRLGAGFTLIELVVTVSLIALALALLMPVVSASLDRAMARKPAAELARVLRLARGRAIGTGSATVVVVVASGDGVSIRDATGRVLAVGGARAVQTAERRFRFFPDGSSSGGEYRVERDGIGHRVRVRPLSGRVEVTQQ